MQPCNILNMSKIRHIPKIVKDSESWNTIWTKKSPGVRNAP